MMNASDLEDIHNKMRRTDTLDFIEEPDEEEFHEDSGDDSDDESNS